MLPLLRSVSRALDAIVVPRDHPLHLLLHHIDHHLHLASKCIELQRGGVAEKEAVLHPRFDSIELELIAG